MHITLRFHFNDQDNPSAVTGVVGPITDLILPSVGDTVRHCDDGGIVFVGKVTDRMYSYEITDGHDVDGSVTVTLSMDRVSVH